MAALASIGPAVAQTPVNPDPNCPFGGEIERAFRGGVRFYDQSPLIPCDRANLQYRVRRALYDLKNQPGLSFAPAHFRTVLTGLDPYAFVTAKVKHFYLGTKADQGEYMVPIRVGTVKNASGVPQDVLAITVEAATSTDLELRGALIHGAAHHYPNMFPHGRCRRGPFAALADVKACDVESWNGAYLAEAEYYVGQAGMAGLPPETRAEARAAAIERYTYHLDRLPGFLNLGVVLYPREGGVSFFDGNNVVPLVKSLPPGLEIANREDRISVVDKKRGQVYDYDFRQGSDFKTAFAPQPTATRLLSASVRDQDAYRDLIEVGDMTCVLFARKISCESKGPGRETHVRDIGPNLRRFAWVRERASVDPKETRHVMTVHVLKEDQSAVRMATTFAEFKANLPLTAAPTVPPTIANETERVFFAKWSEMWGDFKYDVVALNKDGAVYSSVVEGMSVSNGVMIETPELKGRRFKKITGPMIWSKRLLQL